MVRRTRQAICTTSILLFFAINSAGLGADVLPGLEAPNYPTATTSFATATSATTSVAPPNPIAPPSTQAGSGLTTVSSATVPAATVPGVTVPAPPSPEFTPTSPLLEPTPQVISVAPESTPSDGMSFQLSAPYRPRRDFYARVDYFTWKEFIDSTQALEETGTLISVGYLREGLHSRIRAELFGGNMNYDGETMDGVPLYSDTGYFGGRFDFDLLARRPMPRGFVEFFAGLGTRVWQRDLKSGFDESGRAVISYQEDWWTVYLYGGVGFSRALSPTLEFYGSARAGATILTRQQISLWDDYLQPRPGFTGAMEFGLRGKHMAMAVRMETTAWGKSDDVATFGYGDWWAIYQPESEMSTIGLSLAYSY